MSQIQKLIAPVILALIIGAFTDSRHWHVYQGIKCNSTKPSYTLFSKAFDRYLEIKNNGGLGQKEVLTIIDYSLASTEKRMWVIDLVKEEVVYHTIVAHGKNSGRQHATRFSNCPGSLMSSLGPFITGTTYYGKHGLSLYLDGIDKGINDRARKRRIVIHSAAYVSEEFIQRYGSLGRSFGCPALSRDVSSEIIELLAGKTFIYIHEVTKGKKGIHSI